MSLTCVRGCLTSGYHLAACTEEACGGCLPRNVESGEMLCRSDKTAAIRVLLTIGDLAAWLRDNIERGSRSDAKDANIVVKAWAPLSIDALTDLDDLASTLAGWVTIGIDEHPAGLRGPSWAGAWVIPVTSTTTSSGARVYTDARVAGVRAGDRGTFIGAAAEWMRTQISWYAAQPWAGDWWDEITRTGRGINAKWPQVVRARKLPMPCPNKRCDQISLWWHPAPAAEGEPTVICHNQTCEVRMTIEDYFTHVQDVRRTLMTAALVAP